MQTRWNKFFTFRYVGLTIGIFIVVGAIVWKAHTHLRVESTNVGLATASTPLSTEDAEWVTRVTRQETILRGLLLRARKGEILGTTEFSSLCMEGPQLLGEEYVGWAQSVEKKKWTELVLAVSGSHDVNSMGGVALFAGWANMPEVVDDMMMFITNVCSGQLLDKSESPSGGKCGSFVRVLHAMARLAGRGDMKARTFMKSRMQPDGWRTQRSLWGESSEEKTRAILAGMVRSAMVYDPCPEIIAEVEKWTAETSQSDQKEKLPPIQLVVMKGFAGSGRSIVEYQNEIRQKGARESRFISDSERAKYPQITTWSRYPLRGGEKP